MKRCPECDFLYEDEQRLCDMDGTALVPDSQAFPDSARPKLRVRRLYRRVAIALPVMILAVLAIFVFKQQARVTTTSQAPAPATAEPAIGEPVSAASSEKEDAVQPGTADNKPKARPEKAEAPDSALAGPDRTVEPKAPAVAPAKRPSRPPAPPLKKVSAANEQNKDSKIASFFKKTGRLLKKPFKL
jgi:cytoskeletal protein RodZ